MRKLIIIIASIGTLFLFVFYGYPYFLSAYIAKENTYENWAKSESGKRVLEGDYKSKKKFPKPNGIINDYGKIFTEEKQSELTKILYDYDVKTTRQIVIVTIDSIKPYQNIQKYAKDLGNEWGIGNAEKNNGLTIVVCNPCQKIGIATGTGTELILTDEICKNVIDKTIIPEFKNGDFYSGIKKGVIELIAKWK